MKHLLVGEVVEEVVKASIGKKGGNMPVAKAKPKKKVAKKMGCGTKAKKGCGKKR